MTIPAAELADGEKWLSTGSAARFLGVSNQAVQKMVREGRLSCIRTATGRLYSRTDLEDIKAEREKADEA